MGMGKERQQELDEAFDRGAAAVRDEMVCSVCGQNHDRDESAACEGCEPVPFSVWAENVGVALRECREALERHHQNTVAAEKPRCSICARPVGGGGEA